MPDPMAKLAEPGLANAIRLLGLFDHRLLISLPHILNMLRVHAIITDQELPDVLDEAIALATADRWKIERTVKAEGDREF